MWDRSWIGNGKEKRGIFFCSMKAGAAMDDMFERILRWCLLVGLVGIMVLAFW